MGEKSTSEDRYEGFKETDRRQMVGATGIEAFLGPNADSTLRA
jgi:hypothetical protein